MATRPTDPALLHYRSGGFYLGRAGLPGVSDILSGVVAATSEPISGGRHKVFGRVDLGIIPQTSTIASHLPRAVGVAFAIDRATKLKVASPWPSDAITLCSFGDASTNHSVATAAFNTAAYCAYQRLPMPLMFVCEDNGLGISVRTPSGWIETSFRLASAPALRRCRRRRPDRGFGGHLRPRGLGAHHTQAGVPAPADRAVRRARGNRRRRRLPHRGGDARRRRTRSDSRHSQGVAGHRLDAIRPRPTARRDRRHGVQDRRRARRTPSSSPRQPTSWARSRFDGRKKSNGSLAR